MGFDETNVVWLNRTKSGNGVRLSLDGKMYIAGLKTLQRFVSGEINGVKLTLFVPDDTEPPSEAVEAVEKAAEKPSEPVTEAKPAAKK